MQHHPDTPRNLTANGVVLLGMVVASAMLVLTVPAASQTVEYSVTRIEPPPAAYSAVATGFNDLGHVVGWSQFFDGSPNLQGWVWTPEDGLTLLPQPPGLSRWRAVDINNAGIIAGDRGFDGVGQAWRLENGAYELLGVLAGDNQTIAGAINELGEIAGTSRDAGSFLVPPNTFLAEPGQPMQLVNSGAWGTFLNDAGQIVGYHGSNQAFRFTPGSGAQLLGPLGSKPLTWAWAINAQGDVVGGAAQANGNGHVPFLFTDADGMQEIGNFGGGAGAADINDAGVVVGSYDTSGPSQAWIWSAEDGVRFLTNLIDPGENLHLLSAGRINEAGQILCRADDISVSAFRPVVLTPASGDVCQQDLGFGGPGDAVLSICGQPLATGNTADLLLTGAARNSTAWLVASLTFDPQPFRGGTLVPLPILLAAPFPTDTSGQLSITDIPGGGGPLDVYVQFAVEDAAQTFEFAMSNALKVELLP